MTPFLTPSEEFKQVIANYKWWGKRGDPSNKEMLAMFASDRKDMRRVLSLYNKQKWAEAYEVAGHMDTAVRDYIPQRVWDHISSAS
jgi:hypothetical protein